MESKKFDTFFKKIAGEPQFLMAYPVRSELHFEYAGREYLLISGSGKIQTNEGVWDLDSNSPAPEDIAAMLMDYAQKLVNDNPMFGLEFR